MTTPVRTPNDLEPGRDRLEDLQQRANQLVDETRVLISAALYVAARIRRAQGRPAEAQMLRTLAGDVKGWTHTTRLREFLVAKVQKPEVDQ